MYCSADVHFIVFHSRCFIFGGVIFDLDKYIFSWQTCFIWGIRLELSCIQVNTVYRDAL